MGHQAESNLIELSQDMVEGQLKRVLAEFLEFDNPQSVDNYPELREASSTKQAQKVDLGEK